MPLKTKIKNGMVIFSVLAVCCGSPLFADFQSEERADLIKRGAAAKTAIIIPIKCVIALPGSRIVICIINLIFLFAYIVS